MANTTYEELYKRVLLRLDKASDGRALLAAKEAVNDAHKDIARVWDVDELITLDTDSADTVDGTKTYHLETDFNLTRPKDIMSIVVEDESNTRKLVWKTFKWVRENIPYPESQSESKPEIYTRYGNYVELIPIPDDAYDLHILYTQWPSELTDDDDETDYVDMDDVIVGLATDRADAILKGITGIDWGQRAKYHLGLSVGEDRARPDELRVAQPFNVSSRVTTEYWKDPFVKENP